MSVRVRYAPSPTGSPHVGNIRTALFCYLFSRHMGGENLIRLEDTDRTRYVEGSEQDIMDSLHWVGMEWEEGPDKGGPYAPYRQSERKEQGIYQPYIDQLLASGHGYKAFDTPEELQEMRQIQELNKQNLGYYGGAWRDATPEQVAAAEAAGKPFVIRLKMPRGRTLSCMDAIRGRIEWDSDNCDDQVMIKADGMPTYHFAAMVDDHLMGITHVIRGEEWISSTPKHVFLLEVLGWEPPIFVHTTVIKGKDGSKLSKRHGDTRCLDFRAAGFLPEALVNFIALIGWAPGGDRELMSKSELIEAFSLEGLQASPGVFDIEKLRWMNGNYIRGLSREELGDRVVSFVAAEETFTYWLKPDLVMDGTLGYLSLLRLGFAKDKEFALSTLPLVQERVHTLADFGEATAFFFQDEPPMDQKSIEKWFGEPHVGALFDHFIMELGIAPKTVQELETIVRDYAAAAGFEKLGPIVHPLRVALTGKTTGPGLFELMEVLGKERLVARLKKAKGLLKQ